MAPSTQKAGFRPISFVLDDGQGGLTAFTLNIRPEDLTKSDPSRLTAQQTLGNSAFIDNFGPGLADLVISGHTGWRGNMLGDGAALFGQLKSTVFDRWHTARDAMRKAGQDPSNVKLIFADTLNSISVVVVPRQFVLKRSRARPLLMMYQISMTVIANLDQSEADGAQEQIDGQLGQQDTGEAYDSLNDGAEYLGQVDVGGAIYGDLLGPIRGLMATVNLTLSNLLPLLSGASGVLTDGQADVIALASDLAAVGRNSFYTALALLNPTDYESQVALMKVASTFDNVGCVLKNAFTGSAAFPDYSDLYGSSNCSSTVGGSPLSPLRDQNAFEVFLPQTSPTVAVSVAAQSAIDTLKVCDPILQTPDTVEMTTLLRAIAGGVTFP